MQKHSLGVFIVVSEGVSEEAQKALAFAKQQLFLEASEVVKPGMAYGLMYTQRLAHLHEIAEKQIPCTPYDKVYRIALEVFKP